MPSQPRQLFLAANEAVTLHGKKNNMDVTVIDVTVMFVSDTSPSLTSLLRALGAGFARTPRLTRPRAEVDGRGRVSIAKAGVTAGERYRVSRRPDGEILLTPVVSLPRREMLVWENPELARAIIAGISEAGRGETVDLGDFTQYADDGGDE